MSRITILSLAAALTAASFAAGCGGDDSTAGKDRAVQEGAVVYRDALSDNRGGWLLDRVHGVTFAGGRYQWRGIPVGKNPTSVADALLSVNLPEGLAVSAAVSMRDGAALRVISCRELGSPGKQPDQWYEFGIDGRQALIRRMAAGAAPKVLARTAMGIPNGRRVRLDAQCVPDGDGGLVLALRVDGREVARALDPKPVPPARGFLLAVPGIRAYPRPDSPGPATLAWDHFEVRRAILGSS
jgi:hypothetical protein